MSHNLPDESEIKAFAARKVREFVESFHADAIKELNASGYIEDPNKLMDYFLDGATDALYELASASYEEREGESIAETQEKLRKLDAALIKMEGAGFFGPAVQS